MKSLARERKRIRVIGPSQDERAKCPECGAYEMRTYKLDSTLYFCPRCTYTMPVHELKRDIVVVPPPDQTDSTPYAAQAPRNREIKKPRTVMQQNLMDKGYNISNFYESSADDTTA